MRAVVQRVEKARVEVDGKVVGSIGPGILLLLGISRTDTESDADYLLDKVIHLRIFPDGAGKMNLSLKDIGGSLLVVSQFTLYGDTAKGRRPSFDHAASGTEAQPLYDYFLAGAKARGLHTESGVFGAMMKVTLTNDGPVTLLVESLEKR